jgi:hypothetical protein
VAAILRVHVLAIAPELSTLSDQAWVDILAYVNEMSAVAFDGDVSAYRMARLFMAAHIGTTSRRAATGAVGPVLMEAAGGLRRTYGEASATTDTGSLSQTMYGTQYLAILRSSGAAGPFLI